MKKITLLLMMSVMSLMVFASPIMPTLTPEQQYWSYMKQAIKKAHDLKCTDGEWRMMVDLSYNYHSKILPDDGIGDVISLIRKATEVSKKTTLEKIKAYTDPCIANCKKKWAKCCADCPSPEISCFQACSYDVYDPCVAQCPANDVVSADVFNTLPATYFSVAYRETISMRQNN